MGARLPRVTRPGAASRIVFLVAAAAASLAGCRGGADRREEVGLPPGRGLNVLVVSFDALRADALPLYGYPRDTAPAMTAFGRQGIVFDRAYSAGQATPTSFAAAFSGRYPFRSFVGWRFAADATLASAFSAAGYATAFFSANVQLVPERGFGRGFGTYLILPPDRFRDRDHDGVGDDEDVLRVSLAWLEAHRRRQPFLLWIHFLSPHSPYTYRESARAFYDDSYAGPFATTTGHSFAPERPEDLSRVRDLYDGEVHFADGLFRRALAILEDMDLTARTVVVLTADHGEEFMEHGRLQHSSVHEEVTRIPLVIRHPARAEGRRVAAPVSNVDIFPTLAASLGVAAPTGADGVAVHRWAPTDRVVLSTAMTGREERLLAVVRGRHKTILDCGSGARRLFDLAEDPGERRDVSREMRQEMKELLGEAARVMGGEPCRSLAAAATRAPAAPALPSETRAGLMALGYLGGGGQAPDEGALGTDPDPVTLCSETGVGSAIVWWRAPPGASEAEVRVGSPKGAIFARGGARGEATTGDWVKRDTVFYLLDRSRNTVVASHPVRVVTASCAAATGTEAPPSPAPGAR